MEGGLGIFAGPAGQGDGEGLGAFGAGGQFQGVPGEAGGVGPGPAGDDLGPDLAGEEGIGYALGGGEGGGGLVARPLEVGGF